MFRFKEFRIYKESKEFIKFCESVISKSNIKRHRELLYQIRSALLSVILNIAEGSGCETDKEFRRFLEISLRSLYEIVSAFDFAQEINLIDKAVSNEVEVKAENLCKQINSFRKKLQSN